MCLLVLCVFRFISFSVKDARLKFGLVIARFLKYRFFLVFEIEQSADRNKQKGEVVEEGRQ